jgi:hypothetical protein
MTMMRLPLLCRPANASVLFSDHVTASARQLVLMARHARRQPSRWGLNQSDVIASFAHFMISGLVLVRSCFSVFAVMTMRQSSQVSSPHFAEHRDQADLPMPWPDATAMRSGV